MKTAICVMQDGAWVPVVELSAPQNGVALTEAALTEAAPQATKFDIGDSVKIEGRLYQGYGDVERFDGNDVLVRADNDKLYRYNPSDIADGVIKLVD